MKASIDYCIKCSIQRNTEKRLFSSIRDENAEKKANKEQNKYIMGLK